MHTLTQNVLAQLDANVNSHEVVNIRIYLNISVTLDRQCGRLIWALCKYISKIRDKAALLSQANTE